ncbi:MAG: phosphoglycerate mutase family protein [bacterium]
MKTSFILFFIFCSIMSGWTQDVQNPDSSQAEEVTKVYLVRHGERDPGDNPPLNDKGKIRAEQLRELLADSGITVIYCPNLLRNQQTAEPLAKHLGITIQTLPDTFIQDPRGLAKYFISEILPHHQGDNILFVGNQKSSGKDKIGNLQALYLKLGGKTTLLTRYSDMHTIIIKADTTEFNHRTYGDLSDN